MATSEVTVSSEGVYDFNCTPCTQRERFTEARKFCVECGEYFCSTCLSFHKRFGATKMHTLIDCNDVSTGHVVTRLAKCTLHEDKEEDMVCGEHDIVCCRVCIATNHRSCQGIDYLPHAAQSFKEGKKCSELGTDVKNKIGELQRSCNEHMTHAVQLKMRKQTLLKRLQLFKVSMSEIIETLVTKAETDIDNCYGPVVYDTQEHIQNAHKQLSVLNIVSKELENESDPIMVYRKALACKHALRDTKITPSVIDQNMAVFDEALVEIAKTVEKKMKDDRFLGAIKFSEQGTNTSVPNMCILSDGSSCFAQYTRNKITHMDNNLKEIDHFDTESKVWGICAVNNTEIAFTMPTLMKVQCIAFDGDTMLKTSFSANMHCRGIAYCNENLYIAGGGFQGEEPGQINIFDLEGKLLRRFKRYSDEQHISIPRSVIANNEYIYVTDCQNGVICLDLQGERMWTYKSSNCEFPWGICFTPNANILIAGNKSNNIVVVSKNGELMGELLNKNDGISAPKAVNIDIPNSRLLVTTSNGSILKVFEFEDCEI